MLLILLAKIKCNVIPQTFKKAWYNKAMGLVLEQMVGRSSSVKKQVECLQSKVFSVVVTVEKGRIEGKSLLVFQLSEVCSTEYSNYGC